MEWRHESIAGPTTSSALTWMLNSRNGSSRALDLVSLSHTHSHTHTHTHTRTHTHAHTHTHTRMHIHTSYVCICIHTYVSYWSRPWYVCIHIRMCILDSMYKHRKCVSHRMCVSHRSGPWAEWSGINSVYARVCHIGLVSASLEQSENDSSSSSKRR
jgi:hypothetical protein